MTPAWPLDLSPSKKLQWLWVLPLLSGSIFGICYAWTLTWKLLLGWFILHSLYGIALLWMRRHDRQRVTDECPFTCGNPSAKKAILLVHGFVDLPLAWKRQADFLAQRGYYVVVPHIDHEKDDTAWKNLLHEHLERLCKNYSEVELWGHSMGGALALTVAPHFPLKRVVLWAPFLAPYLGRIKTRIAHILHHLLIFWPRTFTFFPSRRRGKGHPTTCYYVNCTLPVKTFASMLRTQYEAARAIQRAPLVFILAPKERVVSNPAILKHFPNSPHLWAADPKTNHQLTNAVDWCDNLNRLFESPQ